MKQIRLLFIVLGYSASVHSQSIKGILADLVDNKPLAGATLTLTPVKDSSQEKKAVSDPTGVFAFQGLLLDSFFLKVSFIGYEEYKQIVSINDSIRDIDLKTIFVPKSTVQLGGVTVTAKAAPVIQKRRYDAVQCRSIQSKPGCNN